MKQIMRQILLTFVGIFLLFGAPMSLSAEDEPVYTTLRSIDLGTFNEYRYKMTEKFFELREYYEVNSEMKVATLQEIAVLADTGYKFLPDNLKNKNYLNELLIDIQRGVKSPSNSIAYVEIIKGLGTYIEEVEISSISGSVEASPESGNAPLTVTLRGKLADPTGTKILSGNYTWWIDDGGAKRVIGRGPSINYTFREEGKFSVFLDVTSSHKNELGNTDVLPYRGRVDISVNEKVASLIVNVNGDRVSDDDELKFTPEDANYGLLFDATSSTPTDGTKFSKTEWDFGNGIRRSYSGGPKIERIRYGFEGDFNVNLKMTTNEGKTIESNFVVYIRNPIAKIEVNREDGYIGDKFTFSAKSSGIYRDLTYTWEILDIDNDKIVHQISDKIMTYTFTNKGKYNVKLKTRRSSGEIDQDTRIVYVTSQAPIAEFETSIPFKNKPNRVFFDATRSFDPDFTDDGNLTYDWFINGDRVTLEEGNANGSIGYYVFGSVGTQSISLEVTDPDGITTIKKGTVDIDSILSVEMFAFPRVITRESFIKFTAESPEAEVFEWDFGDGKTQGGSLDKVTHTYNTSGSFDVKLTVTDKNNKTNTFTRTVYVSESDQPLAFIDVSFGGLERPQFDTTACNGVGAYIVNRVDPITLNANESINIDGGTSGLEYSWKIGNNKYSTAPNVSHSFDEIGCFPVKLTVKSDKNGKTDTVETMMDVRNLKPTLSALSVTVENPEEDPLIVRVNALGAGDPDGVVQSYLWYYYTDVDTQPQDFRSTASSSTSFVIPKITGNYYFVAILKDNNEARVTSEEITGSRYFTTITGDNINTPIVDLSVNDNSVVIGDEIVFTATAQNILGQDIVKDSTFSWDFDGDGFYDTQTSEPTTSYTYKKSGEFYAKVKVKHRGISSTKNVTMNVSNKLIADFGYISIGNKFIFFDSSAGTIDARSWDLGDGTKKTGTYFEHTYTDGKSSHDVKLTISEGAKTKQTEKLVTKNVKNILKSRGKTLSLFTYPLIDDEGNITLDSASERFFIYMGESDESVEKFVIDYDTQNDSDLNGGKDDDEDNKGTSSYISGDIIEIPLSVFRSQDIRIFVKDENDTVLAATDINIEKTYIEDQNIDVSLIVFEDVSESEREKIEILKKILMELPQQERMRSLSYIQKLQENWNDNTEKTRTILDFENYIFELNLENEDEFISVLESLLVEGQEDQSSQQITYQAVINLVPSEISCEVSEGTCYDNLVSKISDIKESTDVEYKKALGKEILSVIGATDLMTNTQKLDFKALLSLLVYGSVNDIPEEEKNEVIQETPAGDDTNSGGGALGFLGLIGKILMWILIVFGILVGAFYIIYLVAGKSKGQTFSEFISRSTNFENTQDNDSTNLDEDILSPEVTVEQSDILSTPTSDPLTQNKPIVEAKPSSAKSDEVPDWLKGNFDDNTKSSDEKDDIKIAKDTKTDIQATSPAAEKISKKPRGKIGSKPELKSDSKNKETSSVPAKTSAQENAVKKDTSFDLEKDTKLKDESNVPDWLKGSFDETPKDKKDTKKTSTTDVQAGTSTEKSEAKKEDEKKQDEIVHPAVSLSKAADSKKQKTESVSKDSDTKDSGDQKQENDPAVPDWLKGSFDDTKKDEKVPLPEEKASVEKKPESSEKKTPKKQDETPKKTQEKKKAPAKKQEQVGKKDSASTDAPAAPKKTSAPKTDTPEKKEKSEELWDDGMKIPDWLKADDTPEK